jgi:hypothetical protein
MKTQEVIKINNQNVARKTVTFAYIYSKMFGQKNKVIININIKMKGEKLSSNAN